MPDRQNSPGQAVVSFGPFRLHPSRRLLAKGSNSIHRGRALDLLIVLIKQAVSQKDPIAQVRHDVTIRNGSLPVHVAACHKALDKGRSGVRTISNATVPIKHRFATIVGSGGIGNTIAAAAALVALFD
jgi:DNA-binding winged helix-turn-helix (wHTH) protein